MRAPLWPTELSRRGTPPGIRTRSRSLRRRMRCPVTPAACVSLKPNPVGHLGVEPSATALSGRPLRPAGSWPADGGGPDPQRVRALPGSSRRLPPGSFTIQVRKTEDPTPCGRPLTRLRIGDRLHGGFIFHGPPRCERAGGCGGWRSRLPAPCGAHPLSKRSRPPGRFILQARKAGDLNARVSPPHPLATEPGAPVRFTFHSYRTADSNREPPGSGPGAST